METKKYEMKKFKVWVNVSETRKYTGGYVVVDAYNEDDAKCEVRLMNLDDILDCLEYDCEDNDGSVYIKSVEPYWDYSILNEVEENPNQMQLFDIDSVNP